jgi:Holliday junction resolvase RusA-like endonuclease
MERGGELLRLTIYGQAAGAGSKTAEVVTKKGPGPRGRVPVLKDGHYILRYRHQSKKTEPWMRAVAREASIAWGGDDLLEGALWIDIVCYENRPDGHYRSAGGQRVLRPDAPAHPSVTTTHDSGKLRRAIEDALTGIVWTDDKRVVDGHDRKDYIENIGESEPKAVIRVGRMKAQTAAELGVVSPPPTDDQLSLSPAS